MAKRLGKDVRTIHRWVDSGLLTPIVKAPGLRGAYFFDAQEVERFEAEEKAS